MKRFSCIVFICLFGLMVGVASAKLVRFGTGAAPSVADAAATLGAVAALPQPTDGITFTQVDAVPNTDPTSASITLPGAVTAGDDL
ncbi:MAG: hypothetical protein ACLP0J_31265, partial [Solirubrobacteraceae bacterium]